MTLVELQNVLGECIKQVRDDTVSDEERTKRHEQCEVVARLAKQMINNADVILRTNKLQEEGKLKESAISKLVG